LFDNLIHSSTVTNAIAQLRHLAELDRQGFLGCKEFLKMRPNQLVLDRFLKLSQIAILKCPRQSSVSTTVQRRVLFARQAYVRSLFDVRRQTSNVPVKRR